MHGWWYTAAGLSPPHNERRVVMRIPHIAALLLLFCHSLIAGAQTTATLSGTAMDENGAVVSGVNISVTNKETGLRRRATSNNEGYFNISLLPPGRYAISAEHQGFVTVEINN